MIYYRVFDQTLDSVTSIAVALRSNISTFVLPAASTGVIGVEALGAAGVQSNCDCIDDAVHACRTLAPQCR